MTYWWWVTPSSRRSVQRFQSFESLSAVAVPIGDGESTRISCRAEGLRRQDRSEPGQTLTESALRARPAPASVMVARVTGRAVARAATSVTQMRARPRGITYFESGSRLAEREFKAGTGLRTC